MISIKIFYATALPNKSKMNFIYKFQLLKMFKPLKMYLQFISSLNVYSKHYNQIVATIIFFEL
jgi:hypothetical protein